MQQKNFKIQLADINKVVPYSKNPRINELAIETVAMSIKEFNFNQPIVVDKKMVVIVGHTRLLAAKSLGLKKVPIVVAEHLTPKQAKAYRIADNKTAEKSEWDVDLLKLELLNLKNIGVDLELTGFSQTEVDKMFGDFDLSGVDVIDDYSTSMNFIIKCETLKERDKIQRLLNVDSDSISFKRFYESFNNRNRT